MINKTKINWGVGQLYTWNPVTGCPRNCSVNGKPYCYARRIHERFNKTPFSEIVFHPKRLNDLRKLKQPSVIFVGSMSDHEYWEYGIKIQILNECQLHPQHTFMFLSKSAESYCSIAWPRNTMQGLTLTKINTLRELSELNLISEFPRPFLSIEPLFGNVDATILDKFERVIVGAMTGPYAVPVQPGWVQSIKDNVPADKIFFKKSMKKYL